MQDQPKRPGKRQNSGPRKTPKARSILSGFGLRDFYFQDMAGPLFTQLPFRHQRQELFEVNFYERVLARAPHHLSALEALGHLYTRLGEHHKGLEVDRRIVSLRPSRPVAHYNLACSLSLTGQTDDALAELALAVRLGYRDIEHLERDPDLRAVRADPRYKAFVALLRSAAAPR